MRSRTTALFLLLAVGTYLPLRALDTNSNGLSDVWEKGYGNGMNPALDPDGDGETNAEEEQAGTNPTKAAERLSITRTSVTANDLIVEWPSVAGKWYTILVTNNLSDPNSWVPVGPGWVGTGEPITATLNDQNKTLVPGSVTRKKWNYYQHDLTTAPSFTRAKMSATNGESASLVDTRTSVQTETATIASDYPQQQLFGEYLEGWIIPTTTGDYNLAVSSDDQSELRLGTTPGSPFTSRVAYSDWGNGALYWDWPTSRVSGSINLLAGKPYRIQAYHVNGWGSYNFAAGFKTHGAQNSTMKIIGTNGMNVANGYPSLKDWNLTVAQGLYAKLDVRDYDSDHDGLSDYEEVKLGLNRLRSQSTALVDDLPIATAKMASTNTLTAGVSVARAYEAEGTPAVFTIFRTGGIGAVTVNYTLTGSATSGADYQAQTGTLTIPFGATSATLPITALNDGADEPTETVTLTLVSNAAYNVGTPGASSISIDDAADRLYIAPLRSVAGLNSPTSGFASLRKFGNKATSSFSLSFTNLSSPETKGEIYIVKEDNVTQVVVLTLSPGQVSKLTWLFNPINTGNPATSASTADITSALAADRLYIRLCSVANPTGEATGQFLPNLGWQTMPTPPTPPAYTPSAPPNISDAEAVRFLVQATFGPTSASISTLKTKGFNTWINEQISSTTTPSTLHLPTMQLRRSEYLAADATNDGWQRPRIEAWWQASLNGNDQLRQRMAFALSQIFVVSDIGVLDGSHEGITNWYDMLVTNAFGNYKDVLKKVTLSPIMGQYLSMACNRQADISSGTQPDENYAREIQQLFSIGLFELNQDGSARLDAEGLPIPTYNQQDIVNFARVFTGWGYKYPSATPAAQRYYWKPWPINAETEMLPLIQYPDFHDKSAKQLHTHTIPPYTSGEDEMDIAIEDLFQHPNVGPFISRQLIQRFVTSNPSPGYIYRVAGVFNNNGNGVRGDLGAVLKAVLMDNEARNPAYATAISYGKLKEPVLRAAQMFRSCGSVGPGSPSSRYYLDAYDVNQTPLKSGSVFNFFQPGYIPPGRMAFNGLYAPEFQIFSETSTIKQINFQQAALSWGTWTPKGNVTLNLTDEIAVLNSIRVVTTVGNQPDLTSFFNHINTKFLAGQMSPKLREQLDAYFDYTDYHGDWWNLHNANELREHATMALGIVFASPEFCVQK